LLNNRSLRIKETDHTYGFPEWVIILSRTRKYLLFNNGNKQPMSRSEQRKKLKIILAEDHRGLRKLLRINLRQDDRFEVVAETGNGLEAVALVEKMRPDLLIMDIRLPGLEGIEATKKIKAVVPSVKILVMSMHNDAAHIYEALAAGSEGYVVKSGIDDLPQAILKVVNGEVYLTPPISLDRIAQYQQANNRPQLKILK
jgi:DNA-binding NarL/FixJ family response regulator